MELNEARERIDGIDRQMLELFAERMENVESIAEYKLQKGLPILDPAREAALLDRAALVAGGRFADCTRELMASMLEISRLYQTKLMAERGKNPKNNSEP